MILVKMHILIKKTIIGAMVPSFSKSLVLEEAYNIIYKFCVFLMQTCFLLQTYSTEYLKFKYVDVHVWVILLLFKSFKVKVISLSFWIANMNWLNTYGSTSHGHILYDHISS